MVIVNRGPEDLKTLNDDQTLEISKLKKDLKILKYLKIIED
jgi:hypothetical protein